MTARRLTMAGLFYAALYVAFFAVVIFRGQLLAPGDARIQSLAAFYSPPALWTDLLLSGFPSAADPQVQSWYPPKLLFASLGTWNAFVLFAYVVASLGVYGYVFALTRVHFAALVSGTVFGMSGFMMAHLGHTMIIHATAWIPIIMWALERLRQRLAGRWLVVGSCAVAASALAGHPQMLVYGLGLAGVYALVMGWPLGARRWRYYAWCCGLVLLGIAASAIQLVPTVELTTFSVRDELQFSEFMSYSLPITQIPGLWFPYLFGGHAGSPYQSYFGEWNLTELTGYVGLLPMMLAVVAVVAGPRRRLTWFWITVVLAAFVLALGDATPLGRVVYQLPGYNKFRAPTRHFAEMALAVSVLAGLGIANLLRLERGRRTAPVFISMGGVAIVMVLAFIACRERVQAAAIGHGIRTGTLAPWSSLAAGTPMAILAASIAVLALWAWRPHVTLSRGLLLCVLGVDLASFGWFYEWRYDAPTDAILRPPPRVARYARLLRDAHQRFLRIGEATNLSRLWGLPSASAYGPLVPRRMHDLLGIAPTGVVNAGWTADANRALDILAVRYVVIDTDKLVPSATQHRSGFTWTEAERIILGDCGTPQPQSAVFRAPTPVRAAALGVVSTMVCAADVPDGAEVARVDITDATGGVTAIRLVAGRDTSEWRWDCRGHGIRHARARVFDSVPVKDDRGNCPGHTYLGVLEFGKTVDVAGLEIRWTGSAGELQLKRVSLFDPATGTSRPLSAVASAVADARRWRRIETVGPLTIFENLRARPRAWLVRDAVALHPRVMLAAIKTSRLPDGRVFDPARVALTERRVPGLGADDPEPGAVEVLNVSATTLRLQTRAPSTRLLVLSDAHYPGWRATIDGVKSPVVRVNYLLRGVVVPGGEHAVDLRFRPTSFWVGAAITAASVLALLIIGRAGGRSS
jgi:Bacterial membrane protein YfhO